MHMEVRSRIVGSPHTPRKRDSYWVVLLLLRQIKQNLLIINDIGLILVNFNMQSHCAFHCLVELPWGQLLLEEYPVIVA